MKNDSAEKLKDKVAVVTGGNSGIGLATARLFIQEGANVVIVGRNRDTLNRTASELGPRAIAIAADLGKIADIAKLRAEIERRHRHIDVIFANAGIANFHEIEEATEDDFDQLFAVNVKGVFFTIQYLAPLLRPKGSIVITSSVAARSARPPAAIYAATKAAVTALGKAFAAAFVDRGIRVNIISPGPIDTPIFGRSEKATPEQVTEMKRHLEGSIPMRRFGRSEEVAQAVMFLASDEASFVTGADLPVDGGALELARR